MPSCLSCTVTLALYLSTALALNNNLGLTPQMGWNSWNFFRCVINDTTVREVADAIVSTGLAKLGYEYVNIDDCWALNRSSDGTVQPDPKTFPDMAGLAKYIHSKGLKFGLYSSAGIKTCQRRPGSLGYEAFDANTYASWGVDYLKYDNCYNEGLSPKVRYPLMRDALNMTGRPIFYSLCEWGQEDPATWASPVGNSWRTTHDIKDYWSKMIDGIHLNDKWWKYAAPGGWNDPDMLEIGNGNMTQTEYNTHFSLWAIAKAPLLIGCDVRNIDKDTMEILSNTEVIAVNQDKLGVQGHVVWTSDSGKEEVWAGPLEGGAFAAILLNMGDEWATFEAQFSDIGIKSSKAQVRDLWLHKDLGVFENSIMGKVESHGVKMYKLTPA